MNLHKFCIFILFSLSINGCTIDFKTLFSAEENEMRKIWPQTNFDKRSVSLGEIVFQALPRDGIPAIHEAKFERAKMISWLNPREPVIVLEYQNQHKAYPLQIMIHHEVVNDTIADLPVVVTFCPLCNTAIIFKRTIKDKLLSFGVSGSLHKSDLIMYDLQTYSWWQQFSGKGIVGDYTGETLEYLPSKVVAFEDYLGKFPNGLVLSRETGFNKLYGENPFTGYDSIDKSPFDFDYNDSRLRPMERVLAIEYQGKSKVYPLSILNQWPLLKDTVADKPVIIFNKKGMLSVLDKEWIDESEKLPAVVAYERYLNGEILEFKVQDNIIIDTNTGSYWDLFGFAYSGPLKGAQLRQADRGVHFAFAWLVFKPQSDIYTRP